MSNFDPNKPVQTVSGIPVTLLKRDARGRYPLIGVFEDGEAQVAESWDAGGGYLPSHGSSNLDLVNVPPRTMKRKVWLAFTTAGGVFSYTEKPELRISNVFGIKELDVEVTEGENFP